MLKKIICLLITVMVLVCNFGASIVNATDSEEVVYYYGYVLRVIDDGFGDYYIKFITQDESDTYYFADKVTVNGDRYKVIDTEMSQVVLTDVFAKYALNEDGCVIEVLFTDEPEFYEDVSYSEENKCFVGLESYSDVPVYYYSFGYMYEPYLDENHKYALDVSEYGINIVDYYAVDFEYELTYIDVYDYMFKDYSKQVAVECNVDSSEYIAAKLYDSDLTLIDEISVFAGEPVIFEGLKNIEKNYVIEFVLEDADGKQISPVYTVLHKTKYAPVLRGTVTTMENQADEVYLTIEIQNQKNAKYYLDNRIFFNGEIIFAADIPAVVGCYINYVVEDGVITIIEEKENPAMIEIYDCSYKPKCITVDVDVYNLAQDALICIALYTPKGTLDKFVTTPAKAAEEDYYNVGIDVDENTDYTDYTVKVMLWADDDNIKPLADCDWTTI